MLDTHVAMVVKDRPMSTLYRSTVIMVTLVLTSICNGQEKLTRPRAKELIGISLAADIGPTIRFVGLSSITRCGMT